MAISSISLSHGYSRNNSYNKNPHLSLASATKFITSSINNYNPSPAASNSLGISSPPPNLLTLLGKDSWSRSYAPKGPSAARFAVKASSQVGAAGLSPSPKRLSETMNSVWKFLRPYTIRGTIMSSIALYSRVVIENPNVITWQLLIKAAFGLIALILSNAYTAGINQIYDVEIDKVNKPFLPIAAGELSIRQAWGLVLSSAVAGVAIVAAMNSGPFITSLYCLSLLAGTLYSVPPFRLKKHPIGAGFIIIGLRGILLNFGSYYASRVALGLSFKWSLPFAFISAFAAITSMVMATAKDLPDVEGDRKFKISTLASNLGVRNVTLVSSGVLLVNYLSAIVVAIYFPKVFRRSIMIPAHALLAMGLIFQVWEMEKAEYNKEVLTRFYQFIWKLFYAEYLIFPII